jgi:hypothetical protein
MIEGKDILQIDATVIVGILIFYTLHSMASTHKARIIECWRYCGAFYYICYPSHRV